MAIEGSLQAQLMGWFNTLDGATRGIFETLWRREPELVSKVISGDAWVADNEDVGKSLGELLGADNLPRDNGLGLFFAGIETSPNPPLANQDVRGSIVLVAPEGGQVGFSGRVSWRGPIEGFAQLRGDAMAPRGEQRLDFTIPNAPAGSYTIDIDANPDGAAPGSPPNANGVQLKATWPLEVLDEAGAADQEATQALQYGVGTLTSLLRPGDWGAVKDSVLEGLNWLVGVPNGALAAAVGAVYGPLSELGPNGATGDVAASMTAAGAAAMQIQWPSEGGLPDVSALASALSDLAAALAAAGGAEGNENEGNENDAEQQQ